MFVTLNDKYLSLSFVRQNLLFFIKRVKVKVEGHFGDTFNKTLVEQVVPNYGPIKKTTIS